MTAAVLFGGGCAGAEVDLEPDLESTADPLTTRFPAITSCGDTVQVRPSTLAPRLGDGCRVLVMAPGTYSLRIDGHSNGVLTLRCAAPGTCVFRGGGPSSPNIVDSNGVILDGVRWEGQSSGFLTIKNSSNIRVQNSTFINQSSTGLLVHPGDRKKQSNIQLVGNKVYNDPKNVVRRLADGTFDYDMDYGFRIYNAENILIERNEFGGGFNHAMSIKQDTGYTLVRDNRFTFCGRACIELGQEPLSTNCPDNKVSQEALVTSNTFVGDGLVGVVVKNIQKTTIKDNDFSAFGRKDVLEYTFRPDVVGACTVRGTGVPANRAILTTGNR